MANVMLLYYHFQQLINKQTNKEKKEKKDEVFLRRTFGRR